MADNSCGCDGPSLEKEDTKVCVDISDLVEPKLVATKNENGTVMLELTLDQIEIDNFASDITWKVSVSSDSDVSDLETFLAG